MFELARIMGTSVSMIESYYGALIDTAHDAILSDWRRRGGREDAGLPGLGGALEPRIDSSRGTGDVHHG